MKVFGIDGYGKEEICTACGQHLLGDETCPRLHNACLERQANEAQRLMEEEKEQEWIEKVAHRVADIVMERMANENR